MKHKFTFASSLFSIAAASTLNGQSKVAAVKPNVLFIMADQHNADVMGYLGHPDVKTPNLDKLAADGVFYTRAYCQNGISTPSRTSIYTGRECGKIQQFENSHNPTPFAFEFHPLQQEFKLNGYTTGCFGKRHLTNIVEDGFDKTATIIEPSLDPSDENYQAWMTGIGEYNNWYRDNSLSSAEKMNALLSNTPYEHRNGMYAVNKTIDFINSAKTAGQPFFCWTSFLHPHQPYVPIAQFLSLYDPNTIQLPANINENKLNLPTGLQAWRNNVNAPWCLALAAADVNLYREYISYYYALVSEVDDEIGQLITYLKTNGLYDNTIIVYVSDHGEFVGAHGMIEKCAAGHNVYEETLRVPLIIKPTLSTTVTKGERKDLVELVDIYPTLLDLSGIAKRDTSLDGKSLVASINNKTTVGRTYAVSQNASQISIITDRYKYGEWIYNPANTFQAKNKNMLFDRVTDPHELTNLIDNNSYVSQKALLQSYLAQYKLTVDTFWNALPITYKDTTQSFIRVMNSVTLPATFKGSTVKWTSGNTAVVSNSGVVTRPKSATDVWVDMRASITLAGKVKTTSRAIKVISIKPPTTEVSTAFNNESMIQFFNRSKGNSVIRLSCENENAVSIHTLLGQPIFQTKIMGSEIEVDLPQGAYVVNVSNQFGSFNKKVIVAM